MNSKYQIIKKITIVIFLNVTVTHSIYAHKTKGHERIEKEAYELLKKQSASNGLPDGITIYQYLLRNSIIKNDGESYSAFPDFDLGRQFLSDRQIYHFMANSSYVLEAIKSTSDIEIQKRLLLKKALPDCLNMVYTLFREIIDNSEGANQAGRGIYVLMHAITDSYSREHTIRESKSFRLETIKSWELSRLCWPNSTKINDKTLVESAQTKLFLHTTKGEADYEWQDENGNLTPEAKEAINAIKDLLVYIYVALENKDDIDKIAINYMEKYFMPVNAVLNNGFIEFNEDNTSIPLSYKKGYNDRYNTNVMKMDRYPQFSHMFSIQEGVNDNDNYSFGYEIAYHITPTAAFSSSSLLRRIPYGFALSLNENTTILKDAGFFESIQLKGTLKASIYLPFNNLVMEPKLGYGVTPFYEASNNSGLVTGVDFVLNFGSDFTLFNKTTRTMRLSIGYEYDNSGLHSYNSIIFKIGLNGWQGRIIK